MILEAYDCNGTKFVPGMQVQMTDTKERYFLMSINCSDKKGEVGKITQMVFMNPKTGRFLVSGSATADYSKIKPTGVFSKDVLKLMSNLKELEDEAG